MRKLLFSVSLLGLCAFGLSLFQPLFTDQAEFQKRVALIDPKAEGASEQYGQVRTEMLNDGKLRLENYGLTCFIFAAFLFLLTYQVRSPKNLWQLCTVGLGGALILAAGTFSDILVGIVHEEWAPWENVPLNILVGAGSIWIVLVLVFVSSNFLYLRQPFIFDRILNPEDVFRFKWLTIVSLISVVLLFYHLVKANYVQIAGLFILLYFYCSLASGKTQATSQ